MTRQESNQCSFPVKTLRTEIKGFDPTKLTEDFTSTRETSNSIFRKLKSVGIWQDKLNIIAFVQD